MNLRDRIMFAAELVLMLFLAAMVAAISATLVARSARADDVPGVKEMMARVEAVLVMHGYPAARGYAKLDPPAVVMVDALPNGSWGSTIPGRVEISRAQPAGCVPVTLSHELTHDATIRLGLLDDETKGLPPYAIKDAFEKLAERVESFIGSDGVWLPNCLRRGL